MAKRKPEAKPERMWMACAESCGGWMPWCCSYSHEAVRAAAADERLQPHDYRILRVEIREVPKKKGKKR